MGHSGSTHCARGGFAAARCGLAAMVLALLSSPAGAAEAPETFDPDASCSNDSCHSEIGEEKHGHWEGFSKPGECQKCHESDDDTHEFTLSEAPALCVGCHEEIGDRIESMETVHDPAEDCLDCHQPHGGEVEALLVGIEDEDLKPLCFECHEEEMLERGTAHGPADRGSCNKCHDPHASPREFLLLREGLALCGGCHEEIAEAIKTSENVHDPAEDDCTNCHDPHSGPHEKMLPASGRRLCNECHDEVVTLAETAKVDHAATTHELECINCHSPHATDHEGILRKPQKELCLSCHNEPVESGDSVLADMSSKLANRSFVHEPVEEGACTDCHQPHGSDNFRLLVDSFPEGFYQGFSIDAYALCFTCHEERLVRNRWSRTATNFRDGDRNLHFLHVNKERKGRTCRACHDLHASNQHALLQEQVLFGRWMMPINFEQTETGGSCLPGCHRSVSYDRDAPSGRKRGARGSEE